MLPLRGHIDTSLRWRLEIKTLRLKQKTMKIIAALIAVVVILGGVAYKMGLLTSTKEVNNEPVVELTAEQKLEEARAQVQAEVDELDAQIQGKEAEIEELEAERDRKLEILN